MESLEVSVIGKSDLSRNSVHECLIMLAEYINKINAQSMNLTLFQLEPSQKRHLIYYILHKWVHLPPLLDFTSVQQ